MNVRLQHELLLAGYGAVGGIGECLHPFQAGFDRAFFRDLGSDIVKDSPVDRDPCGDFFLFLRLFRSFVYQEAVVCLQLFGVDLQPVLQCLFRFGGRRFQFGDPNPAVVELLRCPLNLLFDLLRFAAQFPDQCLRFRSRAALQFLLQLFCSFTGMRSVRFFFRKQTDQFILSVLPRFDLLFLFGNLAVQAVLFRDLLIHRFDLPPHFIDGLLKLLFSFLHSGRNLIIGMDL